MKTILRITTTLLLIFGMGVVAPKMIQTAMIAQGDSRQADLSVMKTDDEENQKSLAGQVDAIEKNTLVNQMETEENDENIKNTEENFPINSDKDDSELASKNVGSTKEATGSVEEVSSSIDKTSSSSAVGETQKNDVSSTDTDKALETAKTDTTKPTVSEITFTDVSYTRWVTTPLNMRTGPSKDHSVITSIPLGEELEIRKLASNGWAEVSFKGKTGFVSGKYLSESVVNKPAPQNTPPKTSPAEPAPAPAPAPTPAPTPAPAPAPAPAPTPAPAPAPAPAPSYEAYKMYIGGKAITYKNGGQSDGQRIIDSNSSVISTWGGAATYSGTDGKNTHFIGHNPGVFSVMFKVTTGNKIVVTDAKGTPTTYKITRIFKVDDNGNNPSDGQNYYNYLTSTRGGEVITLQTCINSSLNLIIRADKIG